MKLKNYNTSAVLVTLIGFFWLTFNYFENKKDGSENRPTLNNIVVSETGLSHSSGQSFIADEYSWTDSNGKPRKASLIRNDEADPTGNFGGYLREFEYEVDGQSVRATGSSDENPGWGYTVNHFENDKKETGWIASLNFPGLYRRAFVGAHHAVHEYKWSIRIQDNPMEITVHWLFADGKDNPLYAITYDLNEAAPNKVMADTRSPYGDLGWDNNSSSKVSGIGWGDQYRFRSTGENLSLSTGWDYRQKNLIPHVIMWSSSSDFEMGAVQTQTWSQHDGGGYWFYQSWGKGSKGPMPETWNWSYQLNQYQLADNPASKRLAWGSNYGAVGQTQYNAYGDTRKLSGYPFQSYSVFMVLGKHSKAATEKQIAQLESVQNVKVTASVGTVSLEGQGGVGRNDIVKYEPVGWNHVYACWDFIVSSNSELNATFQVSSGSIENPVLVLREYGKVKPAEVQLDGRILIADKDYVSSYDAEHKMLWITLLSNFKSIHNLLIK